MTAYHINGRVIDRKYRSGIPRLRVETWDKDFILDGFVGNTTTDSDGAFQIIFEESYFQEIFLDRQPDLYFKIFSEGTLIRSTEDSVLWNRLYQKLL